MWPWRWKCTLPHFGVPPVVGNMDSRALDVATLVWKTDPHACVCRIERMIPAPKLCCVLVRGNRGTPMLYFGHSGWRYGLLCFGVAHPVRDTTSHVSPTSGASLKSGRLYRRLQGQNNTWQVISCARAETPTCGSVHFQPEGPHRRIGLCMPNSTGHTKAWESASAI